MNSIPALTVTVAGSVEQVEPVVRDALSREGFGVLTEIDVAAVLKAKIGVERTPLRILGACNPHLAHQALSEDSAAALLLPCNVVLEAIDDASGPRVKVSTIDPRMLLPGESLAALTHDAAGRLQSALRSIAERLAE